MPELLPGFREVGGQVCGARDRHGGLHPDENNGGELLGISEWAVHKMLPPILLQHKLEQMRGGLKCLQGL